jgi:hypothetical protein
LRPGHGGGTGLEVWKKQNAAGEERPSLLAACFTMVSPASVSIDGCGVKPRLRRLNPGDGRQALNQAAGRLCLMERAVLLVSSNRSTPCRLIFNGGRRSQKTNIENLHNPKNL